MKNFILEPDVPGRLASETIQKLKTGITPECIKYIFECWPEDDIAQADPVHIISDVLGEALINSNLTGFSLRECIAEKGEQFHVASPGSVRIPTFRWLFVGSSGFLVARA